ncbi:type II secretion system F family protein [Ruficoccus amylovorans]|uniref:Type II secretion system F family protein n=1 Tax=Ruficoccus amylovorans TaxID=1804625 RepID=A0A842HGJ2_9BACT|nr:type II secretion system F family protein [Ruficoccus amylovorans]MBC2595815.1 type II secretion system F family protein [Ruficoccus amylovorans]
MAMLSQSAAATPAAGKKKKLTFAEKQRLAKQRAYEKQARRKKIKLDDLTVFTQQLSSMLEAGLPLVSALEALQEQTENPIFRIIIREVRNDISSGTSFSDAVRKFPRAFPNLFVSMVEAGEASGALSDILAKVAVYFEDSLALQKKVKSAMTYPVAVILLAVGLVSVLLIKVIPVFAGMFSEFGAELPKPTQMLIDLSEFLQSYILLIIGGGVALFFLYKKVTQTPRGREARDTIVGKLPIIGNLSRKINVSRFCRTYGILLRSGVPILRALEICSSASDNVFIEKACTNISRHISQGGQLSDIVALTPYFPPMVKHMARAGEQTGNVDGMMNKISDFYDTEVENIVESLTSLMEPILICVLGVIIGGIVMAMFLPIFQLSSVIKA